MSRLLDSIQRALRARAADSQDPAAPTSHPDPAAPTTVDPQPGGHALPAGEDPTDQRPTALRRGKLRKRLRYLERRRELLLRDLGGLVFEIHRSGTADDRERQRELVADKVARIADVDAELDAGRSQLGEERGELLVREPGVGGLCSNCGEVHGSDARFCPACGVAVRARAARRFAPVSTQAPQADPELGPRAADPVVPAATPADERDAWRRSSESDAAGGEQPTRVVSPSAPSPDAPAAGSEPADGVTQSLRPSEKAS